VFTRKKTKLTPNRKIDLLNLYIPSYQISQLRTPVALIITAGRQIVWRKISKKSDYFIDKELGMFEIKPENAFFCNKTAIYIYDYRNQNPIDLGLLNELYKWANMQGLYKIRREDVKHARLLASKGAEGLAKEQDADRLKTRKFMNEVLDSIKKKNADTEEKRKLEAGGIEDSDEYHLLNDEDSSFIIVRNLYNSGYIDAQESANLNHKLTLKQIQSTDDLLHEIESFTKVYVTKPISNELERILDDFHTYRPRDIIAIIQSLSKINKGLKNLRTKPIINWFPATYLLFGALGVAIVLMIFLGQDDGTGGGAGDFLSSLMPSSP